MDKRTIACGPFCSVKKKRSLRNLSRSPLQVNRLKPVNKPTLLPAEPRMYTQIDHTQCTFVECLRLLFRRMRGWATMKLETSFHRPERFRYGGTWQWTSSRNQDEEPLRHPHSSHVLMYGDGMVRGMVVPPYQYHRTNHHSFAASGSISSDRSWTGCASS